MDSARVTPCGHLFHGVCLRKWLFVRRSCPMCHRELRLEPSANTRRFGGQGHMLGPDSEEGKVLGFFVL